MGNEKDLSLLTSDCLVELLSRCETRDILSLEQTCLRFRRLVKENGLIWQRRAWVDWGINVGVSSLSANEEESPLEDSIDSENGNAIKQFLRDVYESPIHSRIRFQGVLCNGGIDENNFSYWIDHMLSQNPSPWCSNCSNNADCLALLLDGLVDREEEFKVHRQYLLERCAFAAALLEQLGNRNPNVNPRDPELAMQVVSSWKDVTLERFFLSMIGRLERNEQIGRLLLVGVDSSEHASEIARMRHIASILRDRSRKFADDLMSHPENEKTFFDASILSKTAKKLSLRIQYLGLIRDLRISRVGSLTCPISSGVILAGIVNYSWLQNASNVDTFEMLYKASRDHAIASFDFLNTEEDVKESSRSKKIPAISRATRSRSGVIMEFDLSWFNERDSGEQYSIGEQLIVWKPLVWFRFHSKDEARSFEDSRNAQQNPMLNEANGIEVPGTPHHRSQIENIDIEEEIDGEDRPTNNVGSIDDHGENEIPLVMEVLDEDISFSSDEDGDIELEDVLHQDGLTSSSNTLSFRLSRYVPANALFVKMINQENLMHHFHDDHSWPNIDMTSLAVYGKLVALPMGLHISPGSRKT